MLAAAGSAVEPHKTWSKQVKTCGNTWRKYELKTEATAQSTAILILYCYNKKSDKI